MSNRGAIARFCTAAFLCAVIILYSGYGFLFTDIVSASPTDNTVEILQSETKEESPVVSEEKQTEESPKAENQKSESGAVEASTPATVKGKIIEKFISPYTANTSYNNVYLKNNTDLTVDIKSLLSSPIGFTIQKNAEPQVLIIHTHTTETFMSEDRDYYTDKDLSRTNDNEKNMVKLGSIVAKKLNDAGIVTIHDTTVHDYPKYDGSYSRSAETVCNNLKKYPSIKIVIDMHRDAIASGENDKVKLTTEINGKKAAQIMLVMGSQSGSVTNFPNWQENLKFAVRLQQKIEQKYPSLARSISLMSRNYNESLTTGSMLIEIGTDGNTLEEVSYSAELLGEALKSLLDTMR